MRVYQNNKITKPSYLLTRPTEVQEVSPPAIRWFPQSTAFFFFVFIIFHVKTVFI